MFDARCTTSVDEIALEFVDEVYRDVAGGWLSTFAVDRSTGDRHVDWSPVEEREFLTAVALDRSERCDVWIGAATRIANLGQRRGGVADCAELPALFADIDVAGPNHKVTDGLPADLDAAHALIDTFPLPPTLVVATGGGLQPWWLLAEPQPVNAVTLALLAAWGATWAQLAARRDLRVDNVFNADRILRLPGTVNRKHEPTLVAVVSADWGRRYGLDDLDDHLIEAPPPPTSTPRRSTPYIGAERPGDTFDDRHSGGEVLGWLGFSHARTDANGDEHWVRPGKDAREGHSATVYAEDGHVTIWSDTVAAQYPALEVRRPYDPYGLWVATAHHGDFSAASAELRRRGYGGERDIDLDTLIADSGTASVVDPSDVESFLPPDLDEFLDVDEDPYAWVVDGLAEEGDRIILTGLEGKGKSTLLRQMAVQIAAGIHPFTLEPIKALRVLYVDCENSPRQVRRKLRPLRTNLDEYVSGNLRVHVIGGALELANREVYNALALRVQAHRPHVIMIGPLYKMIDGDPIKEEPAKALAVALDRLRHICASVLLIEAHSPYPESSRSKRPIRPYGASLWSRWPEFGIYLSPDGELEHWRGPREERAWPAKLDRGEPWPWMPGTPTEHSDDDSYSGPTRCANAVVEVLAAQPGIEVTGNRLIDLMKAAGHAFHDRTVRAGAELACKRGRIRSKPGARSSRIYWHPAPNGTYTQGNTDEAF